MGTTMNRQWLLAARPKGMVKESDFRYQESPIPELSDGQFLVRILYVAFEPAMRGWMEDRASYIPPIQLGEVMRGVSVARYNEEELPPGPKNYFALIIQRARMEEFILIDYASRFGEAIPELAGWVASGQIKYQEDIQEGFANAPKTFLRLFEGKNVGKQLLKIADPPLPRQ